MNYPRINMRATGANIKRLRKERGITVQQIADFMGFTEPVAVYKWQRGASLPTTDNLLALSKLMKCSMEDILVEDDEMSSFIYFLLHILGKKKLINTAFFYIIYNRFLGC